jgi:hypothetical protein
MCLFVQNQDEAQARDFLLTHFVFLRVRPPFITSSVHMLPEFSKDLLFAGLAVSTPLLQPAVAKSISDAQVAS